MKRKASSQEGRISCLQSLVFGNFPGTDLAGKLLIIPFHGNSVMRAWLFI
jgi:hypothetical protein